MYTVKFLRAKKTEHERRVREVTDFATLRPATVLRLTAPVRGTVAPATGGQIGESLRVAGLTGMGADTRTGSFDIDLRHHESEPWSWEASKAAIDRVVTQMQEAFAAQDIGVVAIFAMAPIPILVYLGSALDDKTETKLFPRRRSDDITAWTWPERSGSSRSYAAILADDSGQFSDTTDVTILVEVTSEVELARAPDSLSAFPVARLRVVGGFGPEAIDSAADLDAFARAWRELLAVVEHRHPHAQRYHLVASVPVTAAVALGRHRMRGVHPAFVVYQRTADGTYEEALEIVG
ncbi:SAVED domain-containing protein [Microbacterium sp. Mcb102]|uniref:SAVED domain-containing protein n=1 Tax=Microbacterium sp. Mcb102 TaxID=2926012 RepID=UPI0021CA8903|nr:SAVED domain-containing protein [Microbacterium sp. Mcb102]